MGVQVHAEFDACTVVWDDEVGAVDAGLEYSAVVYPEAADGRNSIDTMARSDPHPLEERVFTGTVEKAHGWQRSR